MHTSLPHTLGQKDPDAKPIHEVDDLASLVVDTNTSGTQWGTGGMATKLTAARIATAGGCTTVTNLLYIYFLCMQTFETIDVA